MMSAGYFLSPKQYTDSQWGASSVIFGIFYKTLQALKKVKFVLLNQLKSVESIT